MRYLSQRFAMTSRIAMGTLTDIGIEAPEMFPFLTPPLCARSVRHKLRAAAKQGICHAAAPFNLHLISVSWAGSPRLYLKSKPGPKAAGDGSAISNGLREHRAVHGWNHGLCLRLRPGKQIRPGGLYGSRSASVV